MSLIAADYFDPVQIINILTVAVGLGLVIFFHELGHFAVAKWCGVYVERFSIGFGPLLFARRWGETEYALSLIPFGGYVKMRGQDDMDPGQMTDEQIAEDPRSYTGKSVPQRMAIISAGVIMNIITGLMFFVIAFSWGVETTDRSVGLVQVGMPAWEQGLRAGDTITSINGRRVEDFNDILRGTALSWGDITVEGVHANGETFEVSMEPEASGIRRKIGVGFAPSLRVVPTPDESKIPVALPATAAARANFEPGDVITAVEDETVTTHLELLDVLAEHRSESVDVTVLRGDESTTTQVTLPSEKFRTLGLRMGMGKVRALRKGSPAETAGIRIDDRIAKVDGLDVEKDLDPYKLTEIFSERAGQPVLVTLTREVAGGSPETVEVEVTPDADRHPWSEPPMIEQSPLSIPSIGLAYDLVATVFSVAPDGIAQQAKIEPRDRVLRVDLVKPPAGGVDGFENDTYTIDVGERNWAYAFRMMQEAARNRIVRLTIKTSDSSELRTVELTPAEAEDWYLPTARGLQFDLQRTVRKADSLASALGMGWHYTVNSVTDIYLTLRGLVTRDISYKGLSGPIGIAKIAYTFASVGLPHFVLFLGLISVNLAVINFLPIPVLDGGHMVFLIWEGVTRRKPSERVLTAATYCGLAFVLGLMFFVIYLDLFVPKE